LISARRDAYRCIESQPDLAIKEPNTMIRQLSILTLVTVLVGGVQPGHTKLRSSTPTSQAVLDEASRLNKLVEKLYSEGKFG
jgi:hypothetical protein